jgi:hypothetical protein
MEFRKNKLKSIDGSVRLTGNYKVYEHLNDAVLDSLCPKVSGDIFHKAECLNRNCSECGVEKLDFLFEELDTSDNCDDVTWGKYEYVTIMMKGGKSKKKNTVGKESYKARVYVLVFQLHTCPTLPFRATWQNNQLKDLVDNLPIDHVVCIHDFSENYRSSDRTEIQSCYFQKNGSQHSCVNPLSPCNIRVRPS